MRRPDRGGDPSGVLSWRRRSSRDAVLERDSPAERDHSDPTLDSHFTGGSACGTCESAGAADDRVAQVEAERVPVRIRVEVEFLRIRAGLVHHDCAAVGKRQRPYVAPATTTVEDDHVLRLPQAGDLATPTGSARCAAEWRVDRAAKRLREGRLQGNRGARPRQSRSG